MTIVVVEDDYRQAQWIEGALKQSYPNAQTQLIESEYEFRSKREEFAAKPPDLIVMDIMLRWTDAAPELPPPPPEVERDGFFSAGIRCKEHLAKDPRTAQIPILFYSTLQREDLPEAERAVHVRKDGDSGVLVNMAKMLMASSGRKR